MKKKLLTLIGGSLFAAVLLAGCAANDQDPPPEEEIDIEDPAGDLAPDNGNVDDDANIDDDEGAGTQGLNRRTNDINTDEDMDMMRDRNTPGEEGLMEDQRDLRDRDNRDR